MIVKEDDSQIKRERKLLTRKTTVKRNGRTGRN